MRARIATGFSTAAGWNVKPNSFTVMKTYRFPGNKVALTAVMSSDTSAHNPKKRINEFSIYRFENRKKGWKQTKHFAFKLDELKKHYTPKGQLRGGKILMDFHSRPSKVLFYVIPDNGAATGLQHALPVFMCHGLPVATFDYDRATGKARYVGIKNILPP